jgi:hypothetical protein
MGKLSPQAAEDIRQSNETARVLAETYGVTTASIYNVRHHIYHSDNPAKRSTKIGRPPNPAYDPKPCACGCGELANRGKTYLRNHFVANPGGRASHG